MMRHKILFLLACAAWIVLAGHEKAFSEPVATLLEMKQAGHQLATNRGKNLEDMKKEIPSRERVGLPVYPGVFFASSVKGSDSGSVKMLPAVNLVATDPPEKIVAWYREHLDGWSYDERFELFFEGEGKVDIESLMSKPTITVMAEDDPGLDLMLYDTTGIRSRIILRYEPKD